MHTINDLRRLLGLATANQVRNRIKAVSDVIVEYLRRGPNNQILISNEGAQLLRRLQDLYDSGLTITEASDVIRSNADLMDISTKETEGGFTRNRPNPKQRDELIASLSEEIAFLRERVAFLEQQQQQTKGGAPEKHEWWQSLRGNL